MGDQIIYLETERDAKTKIRSTSQADDHIRRSLKVKQTLSFKYQSQVRRTFIFFLLFFWKNLLIPFFLSPHFSDHFQKPSKVYKANSFCEIISITNIF